MKAYPLTPAPRGFALLAVLWCIAIMSMTVFGLAEMVSLQLDENVAAAQDFKARHLALTGLAFGLHPQVNRDDPLLTGQGYQTTVVSEGARLNMNRLLASNRTDILDRLWAQWGLTSDESAALDDCLQDWIDADDIKRLNGAESREYAALGHPEYPSDKPFQSVDEIGEVLGFAKIKQLKPDWKNYFTLWSDGKLNVNDAPAELIAAVTNVGIETAQTFVEQREEVRANNTGNGPLWQSLDPVRSLLGLSGTAWNNAQAMLDLKTTVWRVQSVGTVGNHQHTVIAVGARSANNNPVYYLWQEF